MLEKRLRLTVDFKIIADEITRQTVENYYRHYVNYQELMRSALTWEIAERENRLLHTLIQNAEALDRFLTYVILDEVDPAEGSRVRELLQVGNEEEILEPVILSLNEEDVEFFKGVCAEGLFHENTQLFKYSVSVEWLGARVMEIRVLEGSVTERESGAVNPADE
jgi:hypothetical protein